MNDLRANQIIFLILLFVIVALLYIINIFMDFYVWGRWLNRMKNSSGNYNVTKILLMVSSGVALYFLLSYLLKSKQTIRASPSRSQEQQQ
jgi:hypothetical protein